MVNGIIIIPFLILVISSLITILTIIGIQIEVKYWTLFKTIIYMCFLTLRSMYFKFGFNIMNINIQLDAEFQTVEEIIVRIN